MSEVIKLDEIKTTVLQVELGGITHEFDPFAVIRKIEPFLDENMELKTGISSALDSMKEIFELPDLSDVQVVYLMKKVVELAVSELDIKEPRPIQPS